MIFHRFALLNIRIMNFEYISFLKQTAKVIAPSGNEKEVLDLWSNEILAYVSEIHHMPLGNVVAVKHGTCGCRKKIMLTAHADEIGLIITYIDSDGFLYFLNSATLL